MPSFRELYKCVNHRNYVRNSEPVILAHDLGVEGRLLQGHGSAHQNAVAIGFPRRNAVQLPGNAGAPDLQFGTAAARYFQSDAAIAEQVFWKLVPIAPDIEINRLIHQAWLVEGDDPVAVRV
jgi:hypothetical protein